MKNTIRLVHWAAAIALGVILLSAAWATAEDDKVIVAFEKTYMDPLVTREAAITLAQQYTGLAEKMPVRARDGLATDSSIPFTNVVRRPAWEVVFEGVEISITMRDGTKQKNPNISTITVLLDAETGALLKVSSPKPAASGLAEQPAAALEVIITNQCGLVLKSTRTRSGAPFMEILASPGLVGPGIVSKAKGVVAYFGLLTDDIKWERKHPIKDKPYWIIFLSGLELHHPSGGPPGGPGVVWPATQTMTVLDAETGKAYTEYWR